MSEPLLRLIDLRSTTLSSDQVNELVPRSQIDISAALEVVNPLIGEIRVNSLAAVIEQTLKFDGFDPSPVLVSAEEIAVAVRNLDSELRSAIELSIERVQKYSEATLPKPVALEITAGATITQRWQPVDSVGLYVPGGKAVYPSSVIMNAVPAMVSKVPRLAIASPGQRQFGGRPHPTVLATAGLLGVEQVFCMGGATAVAALAFGIPELGLEPVAMVTGPGNIYVAAAKRALRGTIGIDSEAGPTEILILADESAEAKLIAYDLISQAEHDENAAAVLVTTSFDLAESVRELVAELAPKTENSERVLAALGARQSAAVVVANLEQAILYTNAYATEHLEIQTLRNQEVLGQISNAGAIFLGNYSPVSLGDYLAGSNHVLPTGLQAKFDSGLGVHSFLRAQSVINYDRDSLFEVADLVQKFARAEGLPAHGEAVQARFVPLIEQN